MRSCAGGGEGENGILRAFLRWFKLFLGKGKNQFVTY